MSRAGSILIAYDQDAMRQAEMLDTFGPKLWEDDRMIAVFRKKNPN